MNGDHDLDLTIPEPHATILSGPARVGAELRAVRERLGWKLPDLAARLKIRLVFLEAIETGNLSALPAPAYAAGFIRSYSEAMGLDSEEILRRFRAEGMSRPKQPALTFPEPVPDRAVPPGAIVFLIAVIGIGAYFLWYRHSEHELKMAQMVPTVPAKLAPLAVPKAAPPPLPKAAPPPSSTAAPPPVPTPDSAMPAQTAPTPIAASPDAASASPSATTAPADAPPPAKADASGTKTNVATTDGTTTGGTTTGGTKKSGTTTGVATNSGATTSGTPDAAAAAVTPPSTGTTANGSPASPSTPAATATAPAALAISATSDSWVQVRDPQGAILFSRVLKAGQSWPVPDEPGLTLTTGNAGGTKLVRNGVAGPPLGSSGAVLHNMPLTPATGDSGTAPAAGTAQ